MTKLAGLSHVSPMDGNFDSISIQLDLHEALNLHHQEEIKLTLVPSLFSETTWAVSVSALPSLVVAYSTKSLGDNDPCCFEVTDIHPSLSIRSQAVAGIDRRLLCSSWLQVSLGHSTTKEASFFDFTLSMPTPAPARLFSRRFCVSPV